ncbi:MAG TPA: DUF5606 domain-containing protein [Bacteroidales bacterium]|jgi:hypothetical protein|nr:DUF5606 domain-containing protein [Bacteroidales bacterium]
MDLKEIMSVSGQSGLFKFVSQGRNGIIVESFTDKKRMFVNATQKVSSLGDIAIFTEGDEVPLKDVFKKIHEIQPGAEAPDPKSEPAELKKFMETVLPEYDRNRVYMSDIKKLVSWYNSLLSMNLLSFEEEIKPGDETQVQPPESPIENKVQEPTENTLQEEKKVKQEKKPKVQKEHTQAKSAKKAK